MVYALERARTSHLGAFLMIFVPSFVLRRHDHGKYRPLNPQGKEPSVSDKPSYLGLLNAISVAESEAHCYLTAWADLTPSADVKAVLTTVAHREGEHGMAFGKRINELGYTLQPREDPKFQERMAIASSDRSDLEKMELLGLGRLSADGSDVFDGMFTEHS